MAIDLNKPIGAPAAASTALPSKRTMNLLVRERKTRGLAKYIFGALGVLLLAGLFAKFAVVDVFSQVDLKRAELEAAHQESESVQRQLDSYDAVLAEYHAYTGLSSGASTDALEVMDMVARVVQPSATVTAVSVSDRTLLINMKDITLDGVGKLADALRSEELVEDAKVINAANQDKTASLQVTLAEREGE